jgi:hypothetical protein
MKLKGFLRTPREVLQLPELSLNNFADRNLQIFISHRVGWAQVTQVY